MIQSEIETCTALLLKLFIDCKMSAEELALFGRSIRPYPESEVLKAIEKHRLESKFSKPHFSAILGMCNPTMAQQNTTAKPWEKYKTIIAREMSRSWSDYRHPEGSLVLKYHRFWFFKYKKERESFGEVDKIERERINLHRRSALMACVRDLRAAGYEAEQAKKLAEWFDSSQNEFGLILQEMPEPPPEATGTSESDGNENMVTKYV